MTYLIALTLNLAGMSGIYSLMAFGLVRLSWRDRGIIPVLVTIVVAGIFWIAPAILAFVLDARSADALSYALWSGNWLVSGFSVVLLCQTVKGIPRQLEDSARLDGCGGFGIYWHILLPLVKRELGLIAFLTLMGSCALSWSTLSGPGGPHQGFLPWFSWLAPVSENSNSAPSLGRLMSDMIGGSVISTLPVMLIFLFAKRYLQHTPNAGAAGSVLSTR
jgi:multiple sugar transport system permease protein